MFKVCSASSDLFQPEKVGNLVNFSCKTMKWKTLERCEYLRHSGVINRAGLENQLKVEL